MEPLPETPEDDTTIMYTAIDRLECTSSHAMARMRFALHWQSGIGRHTDCYVATKLNLWRDIFPPQLQVQVMDRPVGHCASYTFAPGDLLPDWREDHLFRVQQPVQPTLHAARIRPAKKRPLLPKGHPGGREWRFSRGSPPLWSR